MTLLIYIVHGFRQHIDKTLKESSICNPLKNVILDHYNANSLYGEAMQ